MARSWHPQFWVSGQFVGPPIEVNCRHPSQRFSKKLREALRRVWPMLRGTKSSMFGIALPEMEWTSRLVYPPCLLGQFVPLKIQAGTVFKPNLPGPRMFPREPWYWANWGKSNKADP